MEMKDRIAARLEALKLSPREASLKAGLNTHFLQAILSGKSESPRADNLGKLARALETTPQWLLDGTGDPDVPVDAQTAEIVSLLPSLDATRRAEAARFVRMLARDKKEAGE